jgi:hypothetical protein
VNPTTYWARMALGMLMDGEGSSSARWDMQSLYLR